MLTKVYPQVINTFLTLNKGDVSAVVISSDNKYIVSGSTDRLIKIFEIEAMRQINCIVQTQDGKDFSNLY